MKKVYIFAILMLGYAGSALAQNPRRPLENPAPGFFVTPGGATDVKGLITFAVTTLLGLLGLVSMLFIIIGGYQYVMSGANEELAEKGKKTLRNAIIGLVIAILSYAILVLVVRTLGGS